MAYTKRNWLNNETGLTAANLNNLEAGVEAASIQAEEAAAAASTAKQNVENLSITVSSISDSLDVNLPDIQKQLATNRSNINTVGEALSNQLGWNQDIEQYYNDLADTVDLNHASTLEHVQAKNPHNITAEQVGTYTKQEIDAKLRPVKTISGTFEDYEDFECPNISKASHNLRLDIKKLSDTQDNALWSIETPEGWEPNFDLDEEDPDRVSADSLQPIAGYSELFTGSTASVTWQQLDLGIPSSTVIDKATLCNLKQLPSAFQPASRTAGGIKFQGSSEYPEVILALYNIGLKKHFLVSLGTSSHIKYAIKNNILFVQRLNEKHLINIPVNTEVYAILVNGDTLSIIDPVVYDTYVPRLANFTVVINDTQGQVAYSELYYEGTYLLLFVPNLPIPQDFEVSGYFAQNGGSLMNLQLEYRLSYFSDDSELSSILDLNSGSSLSQTDLNLSTEEALQKLINVGIADPDNLTPGLFYFKYLP